MTIGDCRLKLAAACVLALGVASAAQADTDWDALSKTDWSGSRQANAEDAQTGGQTDGDWSTAIQKAFVDLGMAAPRAECYGRVLTEQLPPEEQQAAAQLVGDASSADDVKTGVISGGPEMVGGFSAASAACPESAGG